MTRSCRISDTQHNLSPFKIHVPDEVLDDLKYRPEHARWPEQIAGTGWESGTDSEFLRELVEYWRTTFDWRAVESRLNSYPQFTVTVDEPERALRARPVSRTGGSPTAAPSRVAGIPAGVSRRGRSPDRSGVAR